MGFKGQCHIYLKSVHVFDCKFSSIFRLIELIQSEIITYDAKNKTMVSY